MSITSRFLFLFFYFPNPYVINTFLYLSYTRIVQCSYSGSVNRWCGKLSLTVVVVVVVAVVVAVAVVVVYFICRNKTQTGGGTDERHEDDITLLLSQSFP